MPKKGLYVSLFEGQQNPDEQQHGEGSAGPVFGPFEFVELANGTQIKMGTEAATMNLRSPHKVLCTTTAPITQISALFLSGSLIRA
jgi:hypothetical protein